MNENNFKKARVGLILLGTVYQFFSALGLSRSPFFGNPILDARYQIEWAFEIAAQGETFRTFSHSPLYSYLVAILLKMFGWSPWMMVCFHLLLLVGSLCLVDQTLRLLKVKKIIHLGALGVLCFYPLYSIYIVVFHKTAFEIFLHILVLYLGVKLTLTSERHQLFPVALLLGCVCGAAFLVRPTFQIIALVLIALMPRPRIWASAFFLLGIAPWLIWALSHNQEITGESGMVSTSYGFTFFLGNNSANPEGVSQLLAGNALVPNKEEQMMRQYAEEKEGRKLSLREMNNYYIRQVFLFLREQPGAFLKIQLNKLYWYFHREEFPDNECASCWMDDVPILNYNPINWSWIALFLIPGLIGWAFPWFIKNEFRHGDLFVGIYCLSTFVSIVTFYVSSRLRVSHVALWVVLIALSAGYWCDVLREHSTKRKLLSALLVLALIPGIVMGLRPAVTYPPDMQVIKTAWIYNDLRMFDQATNEAMKIPQKAKREAMLAKIAELKSSPPKTENLHLLGGVIPQCKSRK